MKKQYIILACIFILTLSFRVYFTDNLDYEAYSIVKQVDEIRQTGTPLIHDHLSYQGRTNIFSPLYSYILAAFTFILPKALALKIIPNIFASSLVIFVFLISKRLTKNDNLALLAAFFSAFVPSYLRLTYNTLSEFSFSLPLFFLAVYLLMKNDKKIKTYTAIIIITAFTNTISFFLALSFLTYLIISKFERIKQKDSKVELILFSVFFLIWIQFLIFKKALLKHGHSLIWQNIPEKMINSQFTSSLFSDSIYYIGIVPLVFGIYLIYKYLFKEKDQDFYLLIGTVFSTTALLWLKLIQPMILFSFLGITFTIMIPRFLNTFNKNLEKTHFSRLKPLIYILLIFVFVSTSVTSCFAIAINQERTKETIEALEWSEKNIKDNETIAADLEKGHAITAVANKKNIADTDFLLIDNPEQRVEDLDQIMNTRLKIRAIELLERYNTRYILAENLHYADDIKCFYPIYNKTIKIYELRCGVEYETKD